MLEKTQIGHIHQVPVYGRLPQRFNGILRMVEAVTNADEWSGLKYVVCCDMEIELSQDNPNISGGHYLRNIEFTVTYNDGTKEFFPTYEGCTAIYLEAGLFKSEYWCAFTLVHELGHHNDPDIPTISPTVKAEYFAHIFSLDRVNPADFLFEDEKSPKYYDEAKEIWDITNTH